MLSEILPRVQADALAEELKTANKTELFGEIVEACDLYGQKHYSRADRALKHSFYVDYVLSQMTLQAEETTAADAPKKRVSKAEAKRTSLFK